MAPAAPRLFSGLLDDAALFPPGNAPMGLALEQHAHTLQSPDAAFVGTFVCASSRLPELLAELPAQEDQLDLSLVCVGGQKALPRHAWIEPVRNAPPRRRPHHRSVTAKNWRL